MYQSAKYIAEHATFQAFVNSYIREVSTGTWKERQEWEQEHSFVSILSGEYVLELELPRQEKRFVFEVKYRSKVGRHTFGRCFAYRVQDYTWYEEDKLTVILALIQELHATAKYNGCHELQSHFDELILRLIESYQTMGTYIEKRVKDKDRLYGETSTFIEMEQALLFGHWLHPTPKSRQGMAGWYHESYAPELQGKFQLHYFNISRSLIEESSALAINTSDLIYQSIKGYLPKTLHKQCLIPMHPLQAEWLMQQDHVKKAIQAGLIENIGPLGKFFTATSSLRTVYNEEEEWMYKFSIPVKVTNSLRVTRHHELKAGVVIAKLMDRIHFLENNPSFHIIHDPAYITAVLPGREESGFEVILRSNTFLQGEDKDVSLIAALVQEPLPGVKSRLHQIIETIAQVESRLQEEVSMDWYEQYWKCAIEPLIRLYDEHGIALEAHQQNSVIRLSNGYPGVYYYRDNQGYYLSKAHEQELLMTEPSLEETRELFYDDALIRERFTYYLFMNQLFSIIHRFGADQLVDEQKLIMWSIEQLHVLEKKLKGQGKAFVQMLLTQEELPFKANLLTRFHDVDELEADLEQAVYVTMSNPLVCYRKEEEYEAVVTY
ncbi:IucA/IucC family protein [Priestia taiwanensis]|uniref:Petrobactin biosynthesis protein AsbA n=1 Tax=Priestia taiwanensis TaxID=1347902 RepID=A0A917AXG3_9BACI|nr:IucA/IucC family protein [Priestia taiwanensis]MBM7364877.1 siderophore synthetase component [Priestia taiwanensis]GGE82972.1 petrobactin biosynthesis protein AsbA [Priestia taiwanensis]